MGKRRRVGGKCTRREKSRSRSESQTKQGRFYKCSAKLLVIDVLISLVQAAWGCPIIYCVGALQRKLATSFSHHFFPILANLKSVVKMRSN